jgi:hypothetical protein
MKILTALTLCFALVSPASAQGVLTPQEVHDRVTAIILRRATVPLPAGDTTVSWNGGPILYHISVRTADGISSAMLRNDSLLGSATVRWAEGTPVAFDVTWRAAEAVAVEVHGRRNDSLFTIAGTSSATFRIPTLPWAVADYGMEEQLVPLLRQLPADNTVHAVAIFRPFGGRWDTLTVKLTQGLEEAYYLETISKADTVVSVFTNAGVLVQVVKKHTNQERRPLERSRLYSDYCYFRISTPGGQGVQKGACGS